MGFQLLFFKKLRQMTPGQCGAPQKNITFTIFSSAKGLSKKVKKHKYLQIYQYFAKLSYSASELTKKCHFWLNWAFCLTL